MLHRSMISVSLFQFVQEEPLTLELTNNYEIYENRYVIEIFITCAY